MYSINLKNFPFFASVEKKIEIRRDFISVKGNTQTSGLVSGLVTIRSSNCGATFKKVGNLKPILISSLYQYPEANLYQSEMHPDGFQFTIPNPDLNSVSIS